MERPKETQTPGKQDKKFHHVRHPQLILLVLFLLVLALVSSSTVLLLILVDLFVHLAQLQQELLLLLSSRSLCSSELLAALPLWCLFSIVSSSDSSAFHQLSVG